jgi:hypothetical protein
MYTRKLRSFRKAKYYLHREVPNATDKTHIGKQRSPPSLVREPAVSKKSMKTTFRRFTLDLLIFFDEHRTYLYIAAGLASPDKWEKQGEIDTCESIAQLCLIHRTFAWRLTYLHDEAFERDSLKVVRVLVVELEVVVEDEGGLHVDRHLQPHRGGSCST